MHHHVEQLRHLLAMVNPEHLGRADYLALLALARKIPQRKSDRVSGDVSQDSGNRLLNSSNSSSRLY